MFGNLVQIELIRLLKSRTLKIGLIAGTFFIIVFSLLIEFLILLGALNTEPLSNISPGIFRNSLFSLCFDFAASAVACVTVVYTTCGYRKARLAVNIECAVRSRIKLYLSELSGIALFILCLHLLVFPVILVNNLVHPSDALFTGWDGYIYNYLLSSLNSFFICLVSYLLSKITDKALISLILVLISGIAGFAGLIVISGTLDGLASEAGVLPWHLADGIMTSYFALPVIILVVVLAIKNRRTDRI